ncbi:hypothetical protein B0H17DRAFT_1144948 [Mycena rosella]|uniref:Uncharacterized protein n=1 Tax=Mycena rosella TaxID=1033263 RepID=A0AAD7CSB9_MYCRO|nr:hypothetical protein B0H17DRAFT_1144948 [Mycena rosella]
MSNIRAFAACCAGSRSGLDGLLFEDGEGFMTDDMKMVGAMYPDILSKFGVASIQADTMDFPTPSEPGNLALTSGDLPLAPSTASSAKDPRSRARTKKPKKIQTHTRPPAKIDNERMLDALKRSTTSALQRFSGRGHYPDAVLDTLNTELNGDELDVRNVIAWAQPGIINGGHKGNREALWPKLLGIIGELSSMYMMYLDPPTGFEMRVK